MPLSSRLLKMASHHLIRSSVEWSLARLMSRADVQGSANQQTPGSENKRIKSCVSCLQQAEERNFFTSFSQNLGFVYLPNPVQR